MVAAVYMKVPFADSVTTETVDAETFTVTTWERMDPAKEVVVRFNALALIEALEKIVAHGEKGAPTTWAALQHLKTQYGL